MYTPEDRSRIREALVEFARKDARITGAALTGSAVAGREDPWSDIDLAFGVAASADVAETMAAWTDFLYESHGALHHLDVPSGAWIYRVFFLSNTLQVDLAFVPEDHFGALAPTFRLLFGSDTEQEQVRPPDASHFIGWAWLYALHVRSSLARGRFWQAEHMISGARNQILALASLRHGLPAREGRGYDDLPDDFKDGAAEALVTSLEPDELSRAFHSVIELLLVEIREVDERLAERIAGALRALA